MKKNLFLAALAFVAMASCTSDDFVGENTSPTTGNQTGAIQFVSNTPRITRASGADAAEALKYKFKVYGVKKVGDDYSNVFATNAYSTETNYDAAPYWVWYVTNTAGTTTSDTKDWEYVGNAGTYGTSGNQVTIETNKDQTIKYWDYSASQYEFVAYSATVVNENSPSITKYQKDGFTVSGTAAELAGLYIADKLTISDKNNSPSTPASGSATVNKIGDVVKLTFRSAGAKVRLGIYETIPGYQVKNLSFRPNGDVTGFTTASTTNAILSGSFNGSSSSGTGTYTVGYDASGVAQFTTSTTASGYFDFGSFASGSTAMGETSTSPTWATGSATYQSVFPNTDHVGNMILYVDYELYNSVSGETIKVKGAKAVVPSIYMKWNPNYAYTYLFKISDNTNGTTGTEGSSPVGIYPISFDAVTVAATDGQEVGTITTVSTPSITTYQDGSVSTEGITYAVRNPSKPIYITVNTNGTLATLTSSVKLYKLDTVDADATEADLVLVPSKLTNKEVSSEADDKLTVLSSEETSQGITFAASTSAKFTPLAGQTYAVEFTDASSVKHYKIIKVAPAS